METANIVSRLTFWWMTGYALFSFCHFFLFVSGADPGARDMPPQTAMLPIANSSGEKLFK